ncbi:MAG: NAD(+) synthase [Acholeplasma sp.]|nr:NAD(+) synthase [Acholeplasma sp.]
MYKNGFLKIALVTPKLEVGHPKHNVDEMLLVLKDIQSGLVLFPELSISGYSCGDLFYQDELINQAKKELLRLLIENPYKGIIVLGLPLDVEGVLYNVACVIKEHKILGVVPKKYIPNTNEFYEKRWFNSGLDIQLKEILLFNQKVPFGDLIFEDIEKDIRFGIEICEDMWTNFSPGNALALMGANLILNISASTEHLYKEQSRRMVVVENSRRNSGAYLYVSSGMMESSSDTVFSGHNMVAINGELRTEAFFNDPKTGILETEIDFGEINFKRRHDQNLKDAMHRETLDITKIPVFFESAKVFHFKTKMNPFPFVPTKNIDKAFKDIKRIQIQALAKRLLHVGNQKIIIGVSGGLDSTLALLIAYDTMQFLNRPAKDIIGVTMPGLGTSDRTKQNAIELMKKLGITQFEKSIVEETLTHFKMIEQDENKTDITYENTQARIRTMLLMNLANKENGIVLGTGDLSEVALGFMTYSGDQMSMYGINAGLPKTLVRFMVEHYADFYKEFKTLLLDVVDTPVSPELIKNQMTEDIIGKYMINDFLLHRLLKCGDDHEKMAFLLEEVFELDKEEALSKTKAFINRFYQQQFKRQVLPDGPKVLDVSLSPRGDFRMPSDIKVVIK